MPTSGHLTTPLKEFKIPIVSWRPDSSKFQEFQANARVTYAVPQEVKIKGNKWYHVDAYGVNNKPLGGVILPLNYYPLWRRLVYGALLQEKMYEAWISRTNRLKNKKKLTAIEGEEMNLRNMAGVRLVQYLLCRRLVLKELMGLRFDNPNPVVHSLIEFGIRESRDWLFETYEHAKVEGPKYLRLDPTSKKNKKVFEEGFHNGLEILFPPRDDDWWKGNFTHFNFNAIFNQIAKSAPPTMADESFENKWIINSSHRNEPVEWNEWELTFFSDFFVGFLELGKDPRDSPLDYFRWRCTKMDGSDEDEESIYQDLDMILGDKFDKKKWKTFMKQGFDVDQFIKQIVKDPLREDPEAHPQVDRLPDGAEEILQAYRQHDGGLELPEALEMLVGICGPGSEELASKLLDDLAVDPHGDSRVSWDIAVGNAIIGLNELKRDEPGKRKGKGKEATLTGPDIEMDWHEPGTSTTRVTGVEGGEHTKGTEMEVEVGGEETGEQALVHALNAYHSQSSFLLS